VARRAHGDGGLYTRKDGRFEGKADLGRDPAGKRQRVSVYGRTRREVAQKLKAALAERQAGLNAGDGNEPLARYLTRWLEQRDPRTPAAGTRKIRYTTWVGYTSRMRRHVIPTLGAIAIAKLTPEHVRALLAKLAGELSATTVAMVRDTLSTAMRRAVKDRLIPFNPVEAVDAVPRSPRRAFALTPQQARAFLRAAAGDPLEAVYAVALRTGLRESEILGLHWRDVDLEAGTLTVRSALVRVTGEGLKDFDPKSTASAATIPLAPAVIGSLRAQRARQLELRFRAGTDAWQETGYVFTTELGTPISASNLLRRSFYPLCASAGIPTRPGLRFHDLRHSCGSLLIAEGVKPKLVQAILRHSKLSTTMDLYVHAFDEDLRGAVASLDRALGS